MESCASPLTFVSQLGRMTHTTHTRTHRYTVWHTTYIILSSLFIFFFYSSHKSRHFFYIYKLFSTKYYIPLRVSRTIVRPVPHLFILAYSNSVVYVHVCVFFSYHVRVVSLSVPKSIRTTVVGQRVEEADSFHFTRFRLIES